MLRKFQIKAVEIKTFFMLKIALASKFQHKATIT